MTTINIPEYFWNVTVHDYHEFSTIKYAYGRMGLHVDYEELGLRDGKYDAVFWLGSNPKPIEYIEKWQKELENLYGESY